MRFAIAANGMTFVSRQQAPSVGPEAILSLSAVLLPLSVILLPPTTIQHCAGYRPSTSIGDRPWQDEMITVLTSKRVN